MRFVHRRPDGIEFREPAVRRSFVPDAAPHALLGIQGRLVPRQVGEPETRMSLEEGVHSVPLVPPRAVDIEPDRVAPEPAVEMPERLEEARPVAPRQPDHATPAEERRHPAAEVEAGLVLAGRGDPETLAALRPPAAEPGVKREAGFIRESDGLGRPQAAEFFLAGAGMPAPRRSVPGGSCSWPASSDNPTGGARVGLGAP